MTAAVALAALVTYGTAVAATVVVGIVGAVALLTPPRS